MMRRRILNYLIYSLFILARFNGTSYGSINDGSKTRPATCNQKIPKDIFGDTPYLRAVRNGSLETVKTFLLDQRLDVNAQNNEGDTDLMLVIKGGGNDQFGKNYQKIFNLLVLKFNRDWNLQNCKGQTALLLSIGWKRIKCFESLLRISKLNPNISNGDETTPLLAAIATKQAKMALTLINCPRIDVNRRGTDHKLPLQILFEAGLLNLVNAVCRRTLTDFDKETKDIAQAIKCKLLPQVSQKSIDEISELLRDQRVNVADYAKCEFKDLIDAVRRKVNFILKELDLNLSAFDFDEKLKKIDQNAQLFDVFLTNKDKKSFKKLLQSL